MFSKEVGTLSSDNGVVANSVQENPSRLSLYGINRCEDQVIGFEFVTKQYTKEPDCCSNNLIHLCAPIEVVTPIVLEKAEFWATSDTCYQDWEIKKTEEPSIEVQRDTNGDATGVLVRFSRYESCCYSIQMAFRLYALDSQGCKYRLAYGSLIFR